MLFWEQSAALVQGPRLWEEFRGHGGTVGLMFWQQSMGEAVDLIATPAPIHKHSGGMIQDCYTQPPQLQERLRETVGRPFNLMNYWGPLANHRSSDWIVDATVATMGLSEFAPDLLLTYIPHLDYDLQRFGVREATRAKKALPGSAARLPHAAESGVCGLRVRLAISSVITAIGGGPTRGAIFPNRCVCARLGLFAVRDIRGMAYTDFFTSRAFAVADHQIAHVYCRDDASARAAREAPAALPGVAEILDREAQAARGVAHPNSGDLVLVAEAGAWFAYPWFEGKSEAPDYASHVDIHNKPGYDPCELYFGWPPGSVSFDTGKIHGTHGNVGPGFEVAWSSSLEFGQKPGSVLDLAGEIRRWTEVKGDKELNQGNV